MVAGGVLAGTKCNISKFFTFLDQVVTGGISVPVEILA